MIETLLFSVPIGYLIYCWFVNDDERTANDCIYQWCIAMAMTGVAALACFFWKGV